MTNGNHALEKLVILLVVLIGLEVAVIGGAVTTSHHSGSDQGGVAFVVDGVQAVAKVALAVTGIVGKVLTALISEAHAEEAQGAAIFLPAAASTGGAHFGYTWVSEDCCGPDSPRCCDVDQADHSDCGSEKNNSI
jgi:hypothetical protein